ncbi:MAG: hypothetical protein ABIP35_04270 [Ginsengibacter sp.]
MKKYFLIPVLFLVACNSNSGDKVAPISVTDSPKVIIETEKISPNASGCYFSLLKKDTAKLQLSINGSQVTGSLTYIRFEKDSNKGSINGKVIDSLIVADYIFLSEGIKSVRQVVFKMKGNKLIEGFGDIEMKGDTARFKNIFSLKFLNAQPFKKIDCAN